MVSGWNFTQKVIRIGHNRAVNRAYRDTTGGTTGKNKGRAIVKKALLIDQKDSALEVLNKQIFFRWEIQGQADNVATTPWAWKLKALPSTPQLCVIFRRADTNKSGNYPLYIPHFNGDKKFNPPSFKKGNHRAYVILADNSQIQVHGATENESEKLIRYFLRFVKPAYKSNDIQFTKVKARYTEATMTPIRADYYAKGSTNAEPNWRIYF
jgi:hypothetical protein